MIINSNQLHNWLLIIGQVVVNIIIYTSNNKFIQGGILIVEHLIATVIIPRVIELLELMGTIVILVAGLKAFYRYVLSLFKPLNGSIKVDFAQALALALEFKLASEILKTVIVRNFDEMYILAAIILLRAILTFVIHWEIKSDEH